MFTEYKRTYISRKNIKIFTRKNLSAKKMVAYMEEGIRYRTFQDILKEICGRRELIDQLSLASGQSRETVRKRVYHWSKGIFSPKREEIFQICFALKLSLEQADQLLLSISEMGIHYRNPKELIYVYGLQHGMTWQEIGSLRDRLMEKYEKAEIMREKSVDPDFSKREESDFKNSEILTRHMEMDYHELVDNEESLEAFLISRVENLDMMRKTVYQDFIKMINLLQKGEKDARKLSVEELTDTYIEALPKKSDKNDFLMKVIKRNWPSKDKLYKMIEGSKSVNRKTMILLFLITEEFMGQELNVRNCILYEEEDLTPNEQLQIRIQSMNLYLDAYGMNRLDLGNPFDCMVLYALKASYEESMSDRFRELLNGL
ncbi:MAG: hypothetical protein Q4E53_11640 [Eubacteriales bacterium]|nr:hypothetical protein [Eubacteriales bacterium]